METMYFTFGVLTMVAMVVVAAVIFSILKVFKQSKQIKYIQTEFENAVRGTQEDVRWFRNDINDRFRDIHNHIETGYTNAKDMANAYTDSRIDKLEDKLTGNDKKLIKG